MSDTLFDLAPEPEPERTHACTGMTCQVCHGAAATAANEAIKRGSKAADPAWIAAAVEVMWDRCRTGREFTTDEVMESLEELGVETHDSRALGGVVRRFLNKDLIREVGTTKSRRRHGARIPVYVGTSSRQKGGTPMKENHVDPSDSPERRPCPECGTTTCSRRPGYPYCYGNSRQPHGTYAPCPGCKASVDVGYYYSCPRCGQALR